MFRNQLVGLVGRPTGDPVGLLHVNHEVALVGGIVDEQPAHFGCRNLRRTPDHVPIGVQQLDKGIPILIEPRNEAVPGLAVLQNEFRLG
jgi:hypothetical protein